MVWIVSASERKAASIRAVSSPFLQPSLGQLIVINELLFLGIQKLRWITDCFRLFMLQFTAFCYSFFFVYAALAACFLFLFSFFLPLYPISRLHVVLYSLLWVYVEHILSFPPLWLVLWLHKVCLFYFGFVNTSLQKNSFEFIFFWKLFL